MHSVGNGLAPMDKHWGPLPAKGFTAHCDTTGSQSSILSVLTVLIKELNMAISDLFPALGLLLIFALLALGLVIRYGKKKP